jgi:hypothetical protein
MNIITDILPDCVEYKGKNYPVKTDFKVWLKFHQIMKDKNKSPAEKSTNAILCCFDRGRCKELPDTCFEAIEALFNFFSGSRNSENGNNSPKREKVFDFTEDAGYIYSAFFQEYGIDLAFSSMHWYRFLALLNGLSESSQLRRIIAWRSINLSEITDTKRRDFYRRMKNFYKLSDGGNSALSEGNIASELDKAF